MTQVAFQLESFSSACPASPESRSQDDLDDAYRQGVAEGRAMAFSTELRLLTDAIRALDERLTDVAAIRAAAERQTVAGLLPILSQIVTALASHTESAGLETAIREELTRLAGQNTPHGWHILCPPGMEAMIRRCTAAAGIDAPDIRPGAKTSEASIILDQGRSAFSQDEVAQHFRDLISELQESYR